MLNSIKNTKQNSEVPIQSGKTKLLLISLFLFSLQAYAQSPDWLWAKGIGGTSDHGSSSIAIDASGNVYIIGYFNGTVDFDPGAGTFNLTSAGLRDIFISKLDASGNFVWAKAMGGTSSDFGNSIAVDTSGNVYTTGVFELTVDFDPGAGVFTLSSVGSSDIFISKLDGSGNFVWAKAMGGIDYDIGYSITIDVSENVYSTGYFNGTVDFDPGVGAFYLTTTGGAGLFISKLNGSGNFVLAKAMTGLCCGVFGNFISVDQAGSGGICTTGYFTGTADFDPGVGIFNLTSVGNYDFFISKLDSLGNFRWARGIGSGTNTYSYSLALDPLGNGDVYTTGRFQGTVDFDPDTGTFNLTAAGGLFDSDIFISKLDSSGNFVWAKQMGGTSANGSPDVGYSIALDTSGYVYTTGCFLGSADFDPGVGVFNLTSAGNEEIFISKLDGSGNFVWAKAVGGTGGDCGYSITLDASGNLHVTGAFSSPSISFGSTTLINASLSNDIFIAKLDNVTGIEGVENTNGISVFPNPAPGTFTFQSTIQQVNHSTITITNIIGEKVYEQKIISEKTEINLNHQPSGIYFLLIKTEKNSTTQKLIIQK